MLVVINHRIPQLWAAFDLDRGKMEVLKWKNSRTAGQAVARRGPLTHTVRQGHNLHPGGQQQSIGEPPSLHLYYLNQ